jgi:hypothetical protein
LLGLSNTVTNVGWENWNYRLTSGTANASQIFQSPQFSYPPVTTHQKGEKVTAKSALSHSEWLDKRVNELRVKL